MATLKNARDAVIDRHKIRDYVLDASNPAGRDKARVIRAATGLTRADYGVSIEQIRQAILKNEAGPSKRSRTASGSASR